MFWRWLRRKKPDNDPYAAIAVPKNQRRYGDLYCNSPVCLSKPEPSGYCKRCQEKVYVAKFPDSAYDGPILRMSEQWRKITQEEK